ncbi:MAG: hypothetical protein J2P21_10290 [Chloracidobacterium sp.]|nr:hypothetical protein [Chloracidobacterium sp.]
MFLRQRSKDKKNPDAPPRYRKDTNGHTDPITDHSERARRFVEDNHSRHGAPVDWLFGMVVGDCEKVVGVVNSLGRFEYFERLGADSIDGTGLARYMDEGAHP